VTSRLLIWIILLARCYALQIRLPAVAVYGKRVSTGVPTTFRYTFKFVHVARNPGRVLMREIWVSTGKFVTLCACKLRVST